MITDTAKDAVRKDFNTSGSAEVAEIKSATAALISRMEIIRDRDNGKAGREASVAITNLQTASMWCALAATRGL